MLAHDFLKKDDRGFRPTSSSRFILVLLFFSFFSSFYWPLFCRKLVEKNKTIIYNLGKTKRSKKVLGNKIMK